LGFLVVSAQKRKEEEPKTQVLPLPKELPMALAADTGSLDFHSSPLLRTGKLSAQIRDSVNLLLRETKGETIIKLRAFVAGAGDARRVQALVSELFTERKLPLPVLTIVQVGALGNDAAQVVIEAVAATKKTVNPHGLAFFSGQTGASFGQALQQLKTSVSAASVRPDHVLSCTCFTSRFSDSALLRSAIQSAFPRTAVNVVQAMRAPIDETSTCEAVGKLGATPEQGPVMLLETSRVTLVHVPKLILTGLQLTFGNYLDDAHESYTRLQRAATALEPVVTPVTVNAFSLDQSTVAALRKTFRLPASTFTVQPVEGLPAVDASAGVETIWAAGVANAVSVAR
jgi:enamine deaminase RidA (YjgF/YER057c/UK114 family)